MLGKIGVIMFKWWIDSNGVSGCVVISFSGFLKMLNY